MFPRWYEISFARRNYARIDATHINNQPQSTKHTMWAHVRTCENALQHWYRRASANLVRVKILGRIHCEHDDASITMIAILLLSLLSLSSLWSWTRVVLLFDWASLTPTASEQVVEIFQTTTTTCATCSTRSLSGNLNRIESFVCKTAPHRLNDKSLTALTCPPPFRFCVCVCHICIRICAILSPARLNCKWPWYYLFYCTRTRHTQHTCKHASRDGTWLCAFVHTY